jgi:hypothetical protein
MNVFVSSDYHKTIEREIMRHTEADYINAGYLYEKGKKVGETLRQMLENEKLEDRTEARKLIDQGRTEARKN